MSLWLTPIRMLKALFPFLVTMMGPNPEIFFLKYLRSAPNFQEFRLFGLKVLAPCARLRLLGATMTLSATCAFHPGQHTAGERAPLT